MTLTFLGQAYEATSAALVPVASDHTGMYRGHRFNLSSTRTVPSANVTLTYRGTRYTR